jgi:glycosyltransferase involved in cell wall biosynthesis
MKRKKVLLIENSAADFYKARIPLYNYLANEGYDVYALVPDEEYIEEIKKEGVKVIDYKLDRKNKGVSQLIKLILIYHRVVSHYDFDIIHSFRFQPNLINVFANFFNRRKLILHITGLGIAFSNTSLYYLFLRLLSQLIFQVKLLRANTVIVQNADDARDLWFHKLWKQKIHVINGSGVNTKVFNRILFDKKTLRSAYGVSDNEVIFTCVTRLIWEKGIREMIEAVKHINLSHPNVRLWLIGWSDQDNPRHVSETFIETYKNDKHVFFLGRKKEVKELLVASDVFLYPSYYREGIPRGILEALSISLPVITTDMPGCNLTVIPGQNGYIINPKSSEEIEQAMLKILNDNRIEMGARSRNLAETKFSDSIIFFQIAELYTK